MKIGDHQGRMAAIQFANAMSSRGALKKICYPIALTVVRNSYLISFYILAVTTDSASSNIVMAECLGSILESKYSIQFTPSIGLIHCLPHVANRTVQFLSVIDDYEDPDSVDYYIEDPANRTPYCLAEDEQLRAAEEETQMEASTQSDQEDLQVAVGSLRPSEINSPIKKV